MDVRAKQDGSPNRRLPNREKGATPRGRDLRGALRATANPIGVGQSSLPAVRPLGFKDWLFTAALVAAVFAVYFPCWHGGLLFDDDIHLLNNPVLKAGGLARVWIPGGYLSFWPLTFTAYWLEFQLWGLQPLGYHLVNIALHGLAALLVWRVLLRLRVPGAMFAAALFAMHPVNVESVAWIAQLKGVLSLVLALVSVLLYLDSEQPKSRWRYGLAIAAFLLSALAKGTALTLPIVLLAFAWWQRGRIERRDVLRIAPFLLIAAVMAGIEVWTQHSVAGREVVRADSFLGRAAVAGCALWFYLGKLFLPINLSPIYTRWNIDQLSLLWYLPGLLWVALLAWAWWRRRSDWGRASVMAIVCYSVLLLPVLGFVNIYFMRYSLVSDHWQYIATIVACAAFAGVTTGLAGRFVRRPTAVTVAIALLATLGALSFHQSRIYRNIQAFYEAAIAQDPDCWMAHNNLGAILADRGEFDSASSHYHKALEIKPDYCEAYTNLGNTLLARGQADAAIEQYQKAIELKSDYAEAHYDLANALLAVGRAESAMAEYEKALKFNPDSVDTHCNLAAALASRREIESAISHYQRALEIQPDNKLARRNLAVLLSKRK